MVDQFRNKLNKIYLPKTGVKRQDQPRKPSIRENFDPIQPILPIFINNFNRLASLCQLVIWLERIPYVRIIILDNKSTYPPLLSWYKQTKCEVLFLDENLGQCALWMNNKFAKNRQLQFGYQGDWYVETDPDIVPIKNCPLDALLIFKTLMQKHTNVYKVGFGLEINDIPLHYPLRENVINWERQYWAHKIDNIAYQAGIDTTFALYNKKRIPRICPDLPPPHHGHDYGPALRTDYPYVARHLPWYVNPNNLDEEEKFYLKTARDEASWTKSLRNSIKQHRASI